MRRLLRGYVSPFVLYILFLAACGAPQAGIERTPTPSPIFTAMLALPVTLSAQPATLTARLQATTGLTFPTATSTPTPTPIKVLTSVPTPQPTNTPVSTHTRVSLTHKSAPVLDAGWTSYTDATYTSDLAFDHQGNLWAVGSGGVIRVDLKNRTYTSFTAEHGLAGYMVYAVAVASDGSLWFGTSGISHFDGHTWTTYTTEDGLADNCVESIGFAPNGEVWALACPVSFGGKYGSKPGRLSRYDGRSWAPYQEGDGPAGEYALFLITAPDGALWLGTRDTISRFDGHAWTHTATDVPAGSSWPAWEVAVSPDDALWIVVERGVARFDGQSWTTYTQADGLASDYVRAIAIAPDGTVWVGTQDSGVSRFDGQGWTTYTADDGLASNWAESAAVAPDGNVWFSTYAVLPPLDLSFAGLSRFDGRSWTTYTTGGGLAHNHITSIAVAPDGTAWAGTLSHGVSRFDGESWTTYRQDNGLPDNFVLSMGVAYDGVVWVGTSSGLSRFDGQSWTTHDLVHDPVYSIAPAPDGTLWVGTPGAIYHFDGQTWTVHGGDHLAHTGVTSMAVAPDSTLWIGTALNGLVCFDRQAAPERAWTTYTTADGLAHDHVTCIAVASDGAVWAGTPGHGVSRFDGRTWTTYNQETGLPINDVHAIAVAPDGVVWVGGVGGVSRFDGRSWATYTQADGLIGNNVEAIAIASDGTLWFGTWAGLSRYLPATPQDQYTPPSLSITAVTTIPSPTRTSTPITTSSSTPTITAIAGLSLPVEALPMGITPGTLTLSAGDSACFNVSALADWDRETQPSWSVYGLPTGATAEFKGQTAGNPTSGCLQIDTPCFIAEGEYPLEVTATVPGKIWKAQVTLGIAACEEFKPGVYTKSMDELISVIVAGKPDFINGLAVPLRVCCGSQPRKLKITVESATSEAGTPLTKPPRFYLFYSLVRPAPNFIDAHKDEFRNVKRDYMTNSGWSLEETITPGLYLLVFEHDSYTDLVYPRQPGDVPKSVTYRLEMADIPCQ